MIGERYFFRFCVYEYMCDSSTTADHQQQSRESFRLSCDLQLQLDCSFSFASMTAQQHEKKFPLLVTFVDDVFSPSALMTTIFFPNFTPHHPDEISANLFHLYVRMRRKSKDGNEKLKLMEELKRNRSSFMSFGE